LLQWHAGAALLKGSVMGSQLTRRWREMDSNPQFRIVKAAERAPTSRFGAASLPEKTGLELSVPG
jgi:hypothetical protein